MFNLTARLGLVATVLVSGLACESTVTGNEGNFSFSYPADDRLFDFNKPIAVGAFLKVRVRDAGDRSDVILTEAASADDSVVQVSMFDSISFTVEAIGDGNTLLNVSATTMSGQIQTDSVNLLARVPEVHTMRHTCTEDRKASYLTGQKIYVPFELEMLDSQPVIGFGYYPVASSSEALTFDASFQGSQYMRFDTSAAEAVVLSSDITTTTLAVDVVAPASISGVQEPTAFVVEDIDVGDTNLFYVRPMVEDTVVCQAITPLVVVSLTPEICDVRAGDGVAGEETDTGNEHGWFEVEGLAAGSCEYTVTFTAGADGTGVWQNFSYTIEP